MSTKLAVDDACCALNILAMRREREIFEALEMTIALPGRVIPEIRFLWLPPDENNVRQKEPIGIDHLVASGLIQVRELDSQPLIDAFVTAAALITDTDASCIALAGILQVPLISDDGKERRIAKSLFPDIKLVSTLDLLHDASVILGWNERTLADVALALRWRGNFAAPKRDPRAGWYNGLLRLRTVDSP